MTSTEEQIIQALASVNLLEVKAMIGNLLKIQGHSLSTEDIDAIAESLRPFIEDQARTSWLWFNANDCEYLFSQNPSLHEILCSRIDEAVHKFLQTRKE